MNGEVPQECRVVLHNLQGIEERKGSNKDIPRIPAIATNTSLVNQPVNDGHEKKANQDGHDVMTHTNGEVVVCNLEYKVRDNIHTEGNKSSGHGQTERATASLC